MLRGFLLSVFAAALLCTAARAGEKRVPIIDSHLHCFAGKKDTRFPYHPRAPYQPENPATPEHLLKVMAEGGVDFAIVVHPEPYQDDHRYLEHCLKVGGGKLKGTCLFFADKDDAVDKMTDLVRKWPGRIVALRIHAYAPERLPPFDQPDKIRRLWKAAGELGLAVQLHLEPRYAPKLEPFIKEFPKTTVIVDHLGRPFQGTPGEHAVIVRWSRFDNVVMKISSVPEKRTYPHRDVQPLVQELTKAYGPARCIYGGGFAETTTGASYRAHHERMRGLLGQLSRAEQDQVLGGNAARLFGFKSKP
jgi:predicted TIM-barrel fold metal-dependent hydrolase